jgi:adenylate cyclase
MLCRLTPKARRNISRIVPFGVIWFLLGNLFLFIELAAVDDSYVVPNSAMQLDFQIYIFAVFAVFVVGLLVGTIEVLYLSNRFADKSLIQKIVYKTIIYVLFLFIIIQITFPIAASLELQTDLFDTRVWHKYLMFLKSKTYLSTNVQLAVELVVSLFYFEISENMGHGVMVNFLKGKYHQPTEEKRIFMLVDW